MTFWAPKDLQVSLAPENGAIGCGCGGTGRRAGRPDHTQLAQPLWLLIATTA